MKKIEHLFKENEGMTAEGSSVQERHEIWGLLFEKELICDQEETLEKEHLLLGAESFYFGGRHDGFIIEYFKNEIDVINVPFQEFKNRLSQLND